jgi:hypothetical protein
MLGTCWIHGSTSKGISVSNNKSRHLLRKSGTHTVYDRPSATLDVDRMADMSRMIVAITGRLETVFDVSDKFLGLVSIYKTDPGMAIEIAKLSNLEKSVVVALFEYFGSMKSKTVAESFIQRIFQARRW